MINIKIIICSFIVSMVFGNKGHSSFDEDYQSSNLPRINPGLLDDPESNRAKGYLLEGEVKSAVLNYGNFITWDEFPAGLWGEYAYLPHVAFVGGVPGYKSTAKFEDWCTGDGCDYVCGDESVDYSAIGIAVWCSRKVYQEWIELDQSALGYPLDKYKGLVFEISDDRGIVGNRCEKVQCVADEDLSVCDNGKCVYDGSDCSSDNDCALCVNDKSNCSIDNSSLLILSPAGSF